MQANAQHTYTFEDVSNSYFMGSDVHVTRDDGASVVINGKDRHCAVNVKDRKGDWLGDLPEDVRALAEDLNRANKSRMSNDPYDREWTAVLYEQQRESWWSWADEEAREHDFDGALSAGRSGGWCCIEGTDTDWWPNAIMHPETEEEHEARTRFLELAFSLVEAIDGEREMWIERIREEHAELEAEREECIVRGED